MFFSLACGGETPSGPSRAYAPGFRMRKDKSPNPSRTRLSRILAQPNPFFPLLQPKPPSAHLGAVRRRTFAPRQVLHPVFFIIKPFFIIIIIQHAVKSWFSPVPAPSPRHLK